MVPSRLRPSRSIILPLTGPGHQVSDSSGSSSGRRHLGPPGRAPARGDQLTSNVCSITLSFPWLHHPRSRNSASGSTSAFGTRLRPRSRLAGDTVLVSGITAFDRILGGGLPRGTIATLEGALSSGRMAIAARLLATATRGGLGALVGTSVFPPALAAAGVRLERLLIVSAPEPAAAARAADILLRSGVFAAVVIPALPSGRGTGFRDLDAFGEPRASRERRLDRRRRRRVERAALLRFGARRNGDRTRAVERTTGPLRHPRRLRCTRDDSQT